jgi:DNA-binding Lrp family transcriptional regulator
MSYSSPLVLRWYLREAYNHHLIMSRHLDTTDIILVQMMLSDSRASSLKIAQFLEISVDEVERRIASLVEMGVLRSFITRYSPSYLKSAGVLVYGRAETTTFDDALARLQKNDSTSWVALGSGGKLYAGATLRKLSHLDSYVAFLREEVGMQDPVFGIRSAPPDLKKPSVQLTDFERKIVRSVRFDARKSVVEIARDIGLPGELVEERLASMIHEKVIDFSAVLSPESCPDILCMFHLFRRGHQEMREFMRDKLNQHSPRILFFNTYRNLPDLVMAMVWVNDMAELREIKASLEEGHAIERVEANIILASRVVPSWADALIDDTKVPEKI